MPVADEVDAIPAAFGLTNRRVDAKLGLHSAHDHALNAQSLQHVVEIRFPKRIAITLLDDWFAFKGSDFAGDLPVVGIRAHPFVLMPDVYHRHPTLARAPQQ